MNLLKGKVTRTGNQAAVALDLGVTVPLPDRTIDLPDDEPVTLGIRPEHCDIGSSGFEICVISTEILGSETIIHAETEAGQPFTITQRGISRAKAGDRISTVIREPFVHVFDEAGVCIGANSDWRSAYLN